MAIKHSDWLILQTALLDGYSAVATDPVFLNQRAGANSPYSCPRAFFSWKNLKINPGVIAGKSLRLHRGVFSV